MKKYISYKITVGGDTGWRFSNHEEWCSTEYWLYFDKKYWTMESIADKIHQLWNAYWHGERQHGWTYRETFDIGLKYIIPFITNNEGVFAETASFSKLDRKKRINPKPENVEVWNINGNTRNNDYDKEG